MKDDGMDVGATIVAREQPYTCVALEGYTNRAGATCTLYMLESPCADCGTPFRFKVNKTQLAKQSLNRRCLEHRRPGLRVKPAAAAINQPEQELTR